MKLLPFISIARMTHKAISTHCNKILNCDKIAKRADRNRDRGFVSACIQARVNSSPKFLPFYFYSKSPLLDVGGFAKQVINKYSPNKD
jgi:hypothetical protein